MKRNNSNRQDVTRRRRPNRAGRATTKAAVATAAAAAALAAGGRAARATNYTLTASDAFGVSSLNTATNFKNNGTASNPAADGGADTYNTSNFTVRTPSASTGSLTFNGSSLQIDTGGRLLGKEAFVAGGGTLTVNNLILNGGIVDEAYGSNDNAQLNLAGTITVNATSGLGAGTGEFLLVQSAINGSAGLTIGNSSSAAVSDPGTVILAGSLANYTGTFNLVNGTLAFNQSASLSLANPIIGTAALSQQGNNTLTLTRADTIGNLFVRAGTVTTTSTITASSYASVGQLAGDNGTLTLPAGTSFANGTNDFNIADNGGTTAATTDTGTVNLTGGTLAVGTLYIGKGTSVTAAAAVGLLNMSAGTLNVASGLRVASFGTGTFNQTGGTATITGGFTSIGFNNGSTGVYNLLGGSFTNAATLDVNVGDSGTGVLNVGGGTGAASFNASLGTFYIGRAAIGRGTVNLNANGTLTIPFIGTGAGTSTFNFNGGTLVASGSSTAFMAGANTINVLAGGAVINTAGFSDTIGGNLSSGVTGGTDGGLTKLGAGVLTLAGGDTYTGPTTVSAGLVDVENGFSLGSLTTATPNAVAAGGGLVLGVGAASGAGGFTSGNVDAVVANTTFAGGSTFGLNASGGNFTYNSNVTAPVSFLSVGPNVLTLGGTNTYTGQTNVSAGTLSVALIANGLAASNIGASGNASSNLFVNGGGTLLYTGPTVTTDRGFTLGTAGIATPTFNVSGPAATLTFGGPVALASTAGSSFQKLGPGTLTLTNGAVVLAGGSATSNLLVSDGGLVLTGSGTAGGTGLGAGSILIGANSAASGGGATFTPAAGDTGAFLTLATGGSYTVTRISVGQGSVGTVGTVDTLNLTNGTVLTTTNNDAIGSNSFGTGTATPAVGVLNISGGAQLVHTASDFRASEVASTSTINISGPAAGGLFVNAGTFYIGDPGTTVVNQTGGTVALVGNLTYGNNGTATGGGTYNLGGGSAGSGLLVVGGAITKTNAGTTSVLNFNGGTLQFNAATGSGGSSLAGNVTVNVLAGGATMNTSSFAVTVASPLLASAASPGGGLTTLGTGTLTLTGANTYAGPTTVAGPLRVNGSLLSTGTVAIPAGGTLGGNGSVGAVAVAGTITAGPTSTAVGMLTTGAQTWNASGAYLTKFTSNAGTAGTTNDELVMSGLTVAATTANPFAVTASGSGVTLAGGQSVLIAYDNNSSSPSATNPFRAALAAATLTLNTTATTVAAPTGYTLALTSVTDASGTGFDLDLSAVAAPEPTSLLLLATAGVPLALGRRRRT